MQTTGWLPYLDYGARMYDPRIGRWFGPDPLAEKDYSTSPYTFCANNPINLIDPFGMQPQSPHGPGATYNPGADRWEINAVTINAYNPKVAQLWFALCSTRYLNSRHPYDPVSPRLDEGHGGGNGESYDVEKKNNEDRQLFDINDKIKHVNDPLGATLKVLNEFTREKYPSIAKPNAVSGTLSIVTLAVDAVEITYLWETNQPYGEKVYDFATSVVALRGGWYGLLGAAGMYGL